MHPVLASFVWASCWLSSASDERVDASYLLRPGHPRGKPCCAERYHPQEGDIVFFDGPNLFWRLCDALAFTRPPDHCGIVVRRTDGTLALLEAGPNCVPFVFLLEVMPRLRCSEDTIWIRRRKCPLTPEESARLTCFAEEQEGKRYAILRFALQITPFRARGWLRSQWFGANHLHRRRWICSEIVAAACVAAGLVNPDVVKANVTYPRDMFDDRAYDLSPAWEVPAMWQAP